MSQLFEELETPQVLIDLDRLERNLKKRAEICRRNGVKLRPHIKTHKSAWIMNKQLELGAAGSTTAKLSEAEVMADAGARDILIAYPIIGKAKLARLQRLMERADVTISTDDAAVARGLSELGEHLNTRIKLYVDVNSGLNRCGREPGEPSAALVEEISRLPGVVVTGLMTHGGHAYSETDPEGLRRAALQEAEALLVTKEHCRRRGIEIQEISVGSTPTSLYLDDIEGVTETRPGSYVFGDSMQLSCGIVEESECAMYVLATVVSTPRPGLALIDAGSKTFSSDLNPHRKGYGILKGNPDVYIEKFSEEHGFVRVPDGVNFQVGDRLMFLPNHCCATTNLHDRLAGVRGGRLERMITVDARGKIW